MTFSHKYNMIRDIITQFKHFCYLKNWTQKEIAEILECDRSHVSKIFSGTRNPSIIILEKMEEIIKNGK